jgi:hypothetical protein
MASAVKSETSSFVESARYVMATAGFFLIWASQNSLCSMLFISASAHIAAFLQLPFSVFVNAINSSEFSRL